VHLPLNLPSRLAAVFSRQNILGETIAWATPCISGRGRRIPPNLFGALVATNEEPRKLHFVARKNGRPFAQTIDLDGSMVSHEPKFLSENLIIFPAAGKGPKYLFIFPRPLAATVEQIVENLRERLSQHGPVGVETRLAAVESEQLCNRRSVSDGARAHFTLALRFAQRSGYSVGTPLNTSRYADMRAQARVHERALFVSPRIPSELELQARWFAGDFGRSFTSTRDNKIDIVQFGTWNREAGPDFSDAAISINGGEPMRGSIEIDLLDRNWELHGHATNPAFEQTVLHVFLENSSREFFARTRSNRVPLACN